jgi:hypothetical protein
MAIGTLLEGIGEIAAGAVLTVLGNPLGPLLIAAGAGTVLSGIGSMLAGDPLKGFATTTRNPISPWRVCLGRVRTGGNVIYSHTWGDKDKVMDLVIVLADHPCLAVDELLFDQQRIQIDTSAIPTSAAAGYTITPPAAGSGTSFTPVREGGNITSIARSNAVVTVILPKDIPYLTAGDLILIQDVPGDPTLNGTFSVSEIVSRVPSGGSYILTFQFLSGGQPATVLNAGQAYSKWADYGRTIYFEPLLGQQPLGHTFVGMTAGVPWQGNGKLNTPAAQPNAQGSIAGGTAGPNPWTNFCSLQGKTAVFLRIQYDSKYYASGLPQISFHVRGKCDVYDPGAGALTGVKAAGMSNAGSGYVASGMYSTGDVLALVQGSPPTASGGQVTVTSVDSSGHILTFLVSAPGTGYALGAATTSGGSGSGAAFVVQALTGATGANGYTENPALLIADYLADRTWGYGAAYGTEIPLTALEAAADVCDVPVALAIGGTEPTWALNGQFELTLSRGEILQRMLTACAGRITPEAPFVIQPATWTGPGTPPLQIDLEEIAAGPYEWRGPAIREQFNGVKGTYISPNNKWQSTDYPYYAQDAMHGYSGPAQYGGDINLAADLGERRWLEWHLYFTISASMAQRAAKVELLRRRWANSGTGTFDCTLAAYRLQALDIFEGTVGYMALANALLEVAAVRLKFEDRQGAVLIGVEIDVQLTDPDIYAWTTEEELSDQGYVQVKWPRAALGETVPWPWSPGYANPLAGDAIGAPASFGIQPVYGTDAQGNTTAALQIKGTPPQNVMSGMGMPQIDYIQQSSGGSLPAGTYVVAISARDSSGATWKSTDYLNAYTVAVDGVGALSGNATIAADVIYGPGDDGCDVYLALWTPDGYVFHWQVTLAAGNTSITLDHFDQSTPGGPDPMFHHFAVTWMEVVHAGPWAQQIVGVTSNSITVGGNGMTLNQWAGYTLSLLAKQNATVEVPVLNMPVSASTASSGGEFTLTIGPNGGGHQLPDLTTLLAVGDLVVMNHHATFTDTSFSDPNIANGIYPTGATGVEAGHVAVVLTGADAGDMQTIQSVGQDGNGNYTIFNLAGPWKITPATGDSVVICTPSNAPESATAAFAVANGSFGGVVVAQPNVQNLIRWICLFRVRTEDVKGNHGVDSLAPMRLVYLFGIGESVRTVTANSAQTLADGSVLFDTTIGPITFLLLPMSLWPGREIVLSKASADAHIVTWQCAAGDTVNGASSGTLVSDGDLIGITAPDV